MMLGVAHPVANGVLALLIVLPLAVFSWFVIERPALRLKRPVGDTLERWVRGNPTVDKRANPGTQDPAEASARSARDLDPRLPLAPRYPRP
jgi:peptidoglycan/LPS O-acetylase OafA/YrhL